MNCTRCGGTGFLNHETLPPEISVRDTPEILEWIKAHTDNDVTVCDCCGNGEYWHGVPGQHYSSLDPIGNNGPYAYNGGFCECH